MSQTSCPGLLNASDWTYAASAMAAALSQAAEQSATGAAKAPAGVLHAGREFFRIVVEAISPEVPSNPVESAANYGIAARAIRATVRPRPKTRQELNDILRRYASVVKELDRERILTPDETQELRSIAKFFDCIAEEGEAEAYEHYSSLEETRFL